MRGWLDRAGSGGYPAWRRLTIAGRPAPYTAERVGMLSMLCLVVVFGIHSLADWTWYVPGNACVALLCAGWLAGRGPLGATETRRRRAAAADLAVTGERSRPRRPEPVDQNGAGRARRRRACRTCASA